MALITVVRGQTVIGEFEDFLIIPMLESGILNRNDLCWEEGMGSWETLDSRFDLSDYQPSPQQGLPTTSPSTDWIMKTKKQLGGVFC